MAWALDLTSCLRSPLVTIVAGEKRDRLYVHSLVLSKSTSPSLRSLIDGSWKESQTREVDWSHTDAETVERVLSFLYTEDYRAPDPVLRQPDNEELDITPSDNIARDQVEDINQDSRLENGTLNAVDAFDGVVHPAQASPDSELSPGLEPTGVRQQAESSESVHSLDEPEVQAALLASTSERPLTPMRICVDLPRVSTRTVRRTFAGVFADGSFPYTQYSYTTTLLAHAQVYCFADCHFLDSLKNLALQRLTQSLLGIDCDVAAASNEVASLAAFIYDNTRDDGEQEPLRKLVSQFATINYTSLFHDDFKDLFSRGGDFTRDVGQKLSRRLLSHDYTSELDEDSFETRVEELEEQLIDKEDEVTQLREELEKASDWGRGSSKHSRKKGY